jgi:hypothetical protein
MSTSRSAIGMSRIIALAAAFVFALAACSGGATNTASRVVSRLIIGAEDAAQYSTIWEKQADDVALAAQLRLVSNAEDAGLTLVRPAAGTAAESAVAALTAADSGVSTIVGHNTGGTLRFADGSLLNIADLPQGGPRIAVISCSSQVAANKVGAIGLPVEVQLRLALRTETLFIEKVATLTAAQSADLALLQAALIDAFEQAKGEFPTALAIALPLTGGGAVAGIFILAVDSDG